MPAFPVLRSLRRTVVYHLGSIALGSFILAVVQFVRLVLEYLDKKTRKIQQEAKVTGFGANVLGFLCVCVGETDCLCLLLSAVKVDRQMQQSGGLGSGLLWQRCVAHFPQVAAWLMCGVKFLAWLLEKIVAFINRNAYILVAVKG